MGMRKKIQIPWKIQQKSFTNKIFKPSNIMSSRYNEHFFIFLTHNFTKKFVCFKLYKSNRILFIGHGSDFRIGRFNSSFFLNFLLSNLKINEMIKALDCVMPLLDVNLIHSFNFSFAYLVFDATIRDSLISFRCNWYWLQSMGVPLILLLLWLPPFRNRKINPKSIQVQSNLH